jgi:hypothetical protein
MKIYNNDEKKFTEKIYDIFNNKLRIFYNYYAKIGLSDIQYHNVFLVILKERATTFYYNNLSNKSYNFENIIIKTKIHFEIKENCQLYLSK